MEGSYNTISNMELEYNSPIAVGGFRQTSSDGSLLASTSAADGGADIH